MKLRLDLQMFADGKVVIETDLDKTGLENGLKQIKDVAKKGFSAVATGVGVAATAITGLVAKSVSAAGELEQQLGGTEAVFGKFADTVQDKAAKAFDTMGVSANDFMATANKMGALMQGSGISIEDSMELSTAAMQRAADVASIMGIDINSAMESIAGAAKGNFTMMDNLGVAMNATTIEAYALSKGIDESYASMDNATKIGLAMDMFLERTAYAEGNYAKENETFAGSFNTLKAAMGNFLSGTGSIQDVSKALLGFSKILLKNIKEIAPKVISGLIELTNTIIKELPDILETALPSIIEGASQLIMTLTTTLIEMLPMLLEMGIQLLMELAKGIVQALPTLIPVITRIILDIVNILLDHIDEIIEMGIQILVALTEGIMEALPELIARLPEIIIKIVMTLIELAPELLSAALRIIVTLAEGLIKFVPELIKRIPEIIKSMVNALKEGVKDFFNIGKNLITGLWNGIKDTWESLKGKVKDIGNGITGAFKSVFGIHSPSKVFADEIGSQLSAGLGVGFEDGLDDVYRDMQNAIDLETSKLSANVESSGTYQMAMSGIPTFNLVDNTNNTTQLVVNGKVLAEVVNTENRNREVATA